MADGSDFITDLETFDSETGEANVIIEPPRGRRTKIKYDPKARLFRLDKVLTVGMAFPLDFGFFPSTTGEDGDPLDALVLLDEPASPGLLVRTRLISVIEAEQTAEGKTVRNDRILAVAAKSLDWERIQTLSDLGDTFLTQLEPFFVAYNEMENRQFKPIRRADAAHARALIEKGQAQYQARASVS